MKIEARRKLIEQVVDHHGDHDDHDDQDDHDDVVGDAFVSKWQHSMTQMG